MIDIGNGIEAEILEDGKRVKFYKNGVLLEEETFTTTKRPTPRAINNIATRLGVSQPHRLISKLDRFWDGNGAREVLPFKKCCSH